jgi:hypothetical protein
MGIMAKTVKGTMAKEKPAVQRRRLRRGSEEERYAAAENETVDTIMDADMCTCNWLH